MEIIRANRKFLPFVAILIMSFFATCDVFSASISSFTLSTDTVEMNITPTATSSASATGSHIATITTDCAAGYKIYVSMASNAIDNKLHLNGNSSNATVGTNALGPTSGSLDTMAALSNNSWGVKVGTGTTSSNFAAVPTYSSISTTNQSSNPTALITGSTSASGTSYTITYAANASSALTPGEYTGNVLYTAIMDQGCYTAEVTATKASDSASQAAFSAVSGSGTYTIGSQVTLGYTLNTGYHFTGWTVKDTNNNNITVTNNKFTMPSTNVTATASGEPNSTTINYNAGTGVTGTPSKTSETAYYGTNVTMPTVGTMTKTGYGLIGWSLTNGATTATWTSGQSGINPTAIKSDLGSTDGGSITVYAVWEYITPFPDSLTTMQGMTDSACAIAGVGATKTLTDLRDDNTYTVKKLADGKCWMTQNLAIMDATISSEDSNLPSGTSFTLPASTDGWGVYLDSAQVARLHNDSTYGVVYSYYAATGGGAWYKDGKSDGTIITQDICPKGWRLPTGGAVDASTGNGEFQTLYNNYNSYALMTDASGPQFTLAGFYDAGSRVETGSYGYYWSSTTYNTNNAYFFVLSTEGVGPQVQYLKYEGLSVRCLAKPDSEKTISDLYYMQDINQAIINNTPQGTSATLTDKRDGKTYTVKKLNDGKIWMTQNLRLINKTITSADSNMLSGNTFTVPASNDGSWDAGYNAYDTGDSDYGVFYNATTVSAGERAVNDGKSSSAITQDICPKNWRVMQETDIENFPGAEEDGDSYVLGAETINAFEFVKAGHIDQRQNYVYSGSESKYWFGYMDTNSDHDAHLMQVNTSSIDIDSNNWYMGLPIRCIAKSDSEKTISDIKYMQDINQTIIDNTAQGASATLTDKRDGKTYTVKKLKDDKIWMTQNLRLINKTITSSDSNITTSSFTVPASTTGWGSWSDAGSATSTKTYDTGNTSYGVLYNYVTASAGTSWMNKDLSSLTQDICPKGWRLPTGDSSGEFGALDIAYGGTGAGRSNANTSSNFTGSDMSFVFSGYYYSGSHEDAGTSGYYWSSGQFSVYVAYSLRVSSNGFLGLSDRHGKYYGCSVRCLAK